MSYLGINKEYILIINEITHIENIYIPDQSLVLFGGYADKNKNIYYHMKLNIGCNMNLDQSAKIYLTRTNLSKKDCFNEEYFETFYKNRGYKIISPEKLSVTDQIKIISSASKIVCTAGTLSHLAVLFGHPDMELTMLLRENSTSSLLPQIILNQSMGIKYNVVDVSCSILPGSHINTLFLLGPSFQWKKYLHENNIAFLKSEIEMEWKYAIEYLHQCAKIYTSNSNFYKINENFDFFDVLQRLSLVFLDKEISRADFNTPSKKDLLNKIKKLEKRNVSSTKKK